MEKNDFLAWNDFIYQLYTAGGIEQIRAVCLRRLRQMIPCSYASVIMAHAEGGAVRLSDPVCIPPEFEEAEREYLKLEEIDHTDWLLYSADMTVIRESDLLGESRRLSSPIYRQCYSRYRIYDTLQMSIVYGGQVLGVLTLYRTREEGAFLDDEMFYLRAAGRHISYVFFRALHGGDGSRSEESLRRLASGHGLTNRETQVLGLIAEGLDNAAIAERLGISGHTLLKHIQNIYRKMGVGSRWELLKKC